MIVGEAWGSEEASCGKPFAGQSGRELFRMLGEAFEIAPDLLTSALAERNFAEWLRKRELWLNEASILLCNVVAKRPPDNDFTHFLYPTAEKQHASLHRGVYCKPDLKLGMDNLCRLINLCDPALVVAAGNWPLWALTDHSEVTTTRGYKTPKGIVKWRGSQLWLRDGFGNDSAKRYPCLPILHPAAILREWGWRNITVHDLRARAGRFLVGSRSSKSTADWSPPNRTFNLWKPSWPQIAARLAHWRRAADELTATSRRRLDHNPHRGGMGAAGEAGRLGEPGDAARAIQPGDSDYLWLSVDLETWKRKFISVVGIADRDFELCVPLFTVAGGKITPYLTLQQELDFWSELKALLEHPHVRLYGQNFIYDTEWLHRYYNIKAIVSFDTMVAHHLLFPGTPKRLDYLASLYCDHFIYWKDESGNWDAEDLNAEQLWRYSCKDTRATYEIGELLHGVIEKQGLTELYNERMEAWLLSRKLALTGTLFDQTLQKEMRLQLLEEANLISNWLLNAVPASWQYTSTGKPWYDSPKGTADLLYSALGLQAVLHKKTKKPTTDDAALAELSERPQALWLKPLFDRLRHLRSLGVFTSNFLDARTSPDGRMRSTFNIAHPETFRWSSNRNGFGEGLNGQNIPKYTGPKEEAEEIEQQNEELFDGEL